MSNYFIEFALVHMLVFTVYKLLLGRETQIAITRSYLLASTVLAIIIPLIDLPTTTTLPNINITDTVSTFVLPIPTVTESIIEPSFFSTLHWAYWLLIIVSIAVTIRIIIALVKIYTIYAKSEALIMHGRTIRHSDELESSFTFLKWIFINKNSVDDYEDIIRHEEAHIKFGHSYDLIFLNLLAIPFWWVPSIWLTIRELKQLHEYQADAYVLRANHYKNYVRTLINYTLSKHGFVLTNSFNDTPLSKRLNYMKKFKKKISLWKISGVLALLSFTFYIFSCQTLHSVKTEPNPKESDEILQVVENPAHYEGGIEAFYEYVQENLVYPEKAKEMGIEGKVFVEFVVEKNGSISNSKILRGIGAGCDEEVLKMVQNSPAWAPASQRGIPVRQRMVLPVTFSQAKEVEVPEEIAIPEIPIDKFKLTEETDEIFQVVDSPAGFKGGIAAFYSFISENLEYPAQAQRMGIEGKVFVEFIVEKDGSISNIKILRGIGAGCDEEAARAVQSSPVWEPGSQSGITVRQRMVLPITFSLARDPAIKKDTEIEEIRIDESVEEKTDKIFIIVEHPAEFKGGITAFNSFISESMEYPAQAQRMGLEGKVFVEFVVEKDGSISNTKVLRGIGAGCDEEAARILLSSPAWTPGKQRGRTVKQRMVLPITFKLK